MPERELREAIKEAGITDISTIAMLFSFNETVSDGKEYINDKEDVQRMAELGVIQNLGFGRYRVTSFGHWLIESEFHQSPSLPLKAGRQSQEP